MAQDRFTAIGGLSKSTNVPHMAAAPVAATGDFA